MSRFCNFRDAVRSPGRSRERDVNPSAAKSGARPGKRKRCGGGDTETTPSRSIVPDSPAHVCTALLPTVEESRPCASPSRASRPRRVVLDAIEIARKKQRSRWQHARDEVSSHYPSPRSSRASPEPTPQLKTSKYFSPASSSPGPTRTTNLAHAPILTPPSSPVVTAPAVDTTSPAASEYPLLDPSLNRGATNGSRRGLTWYGNPGLFDGLMVMLRRLKPILVQETVRDDPWKVLIAVRLLNVTTGKAAIPVFCKIISRWPTPKDLAQAPHDELVRLLRPLGLYNKRARWLKSMSERFIEDGRAPRAVHLSEGEVRCPGVGPYALDSLRIFCAADEDAWKGVMPRDKELIRYLRWRWAVEQGKMWYPGGTGVIRDVDVPYLITLVDELAVHYDEAIGGEGYMYHFFNDLWPTRTLYPFNYIRVHGYASKAGSATLEIRTIRRHVRALYAQCHVAYEVAPFDEALYQACIKDAVQRGYPVDGDASVRTYLREAVVYASNATAHIPHRAAQTWIALYMSCAFFVDETFARFPSAIPDVYLFCDRLVRGTRQDGVLGAFADVLRRASDMYRPVASQLITTSTVDFVTANLLEHETRSMKISSAARQYPIYQRTLSGVGGALGFMAFPGGMPLNEYVQAIPEIMLFIQHVNDVLSFYKEECDGEMTNHVSTLAARTGASRMETFGRVAETAIDLYKRIVEILEAPEARRAFQLYTSGMFRFHSSTTRYRLEELDL